MVPAATGLSFAADGWYLLVAGLHRGLVYLPPAARLAGGAATTGLVFSSARYYYGPKATGRFVAAYALVALVYIARTHLVVQEREWRAGAVRYERGFAPGLCGASFLIAVLALLVAWSTPCSGANARAGDAPV